MAGPVGMGGRPGVDAGFVRVVTPDGETVKIHEKDLDEALSHGARVTTPDESIASGQKEELGNSPGTAAVASVLRGATVGLSDVALTKAAALVHGEEGSAKMGSYLKGLKEQNPGISLGGEIGGNILGLAAGPVAAIGKVGTAVKAGLAARGLAPVLSAAASGAVEGGLFGLGQVVSEDALGDHQTNAQKLAAITGAGIFGAGLNAFTHGLSVAGTKLVERYGGKSLKEGLENLSDEALMTQIGSRKIMKKRDLFGSRGDEVMKYARDNGIVTLGDDAESFAAKAVEQTGKVGSEMGELLTQASEKLPQFDGKAFAAKVRTGALTELEKLPGTEGIVNRIENDLGKLEKGQTLQEAWNFQSKLHKSLGFGEAPEAKRAIADFQKALVGEIKDQVSAVQPGFKKAMDEVSNRYSLASSLEALAMEQLEATKGKGIGLRDAITGGGIGTAMATAASGPVGLATGVAGAMATKAVRERGGFAASAAFNKLAQSETFLKMGEGLKARIESLAESGLLGKYQPVLQAAGAKGINELLATHVQLAKADPLYLPTLGMEHEDAQAANDYAQKAEQLQHVAGVLKKQDDQVVASVNRFLGTSPGRAPSLQPLEVSVADFKKRMERLNQVIRAPETASTGNFNGVAPKTATQFAIQTQNAAAFLQQKAPKSPYEGVLPAFQQPWEPSKADLEKWYRYAGAVEDPHSVLKELAKNHSVSAEAVEALKTVYPALLEDLKQKTMERLSEYKKPLTYQQSRGLSQLYGTDFVNQNPKQADLLQKMHASNIAAKQPASRPDGRQSQSQEDNVSTQAVRIANR